jgi:hypothetical protein
MQDSSLLSEHQVHLQSHPNDPFYKFAVFNDFKLDQHFEQVDQPTHSLFQPVFSSNVSNVSFTTSQVGF